MGKPVLVGTDIPFFSTAQASHQDLFDRVALHLLKQSRKSQTVEGRCYYRGPDNTKCAVGCLIDDAFYSPDLEGACTSNPRVSAAVEASLGYKLDTQTWELLRALQSAHDNNPLEYWRPALAMVADRFALSLTVLKTPSLQEIFNRVALHLLNQAKRAMSDGGRCKYRQKVGKETLACAVGCLITDENYKPTLENKTVDDASIRASVERSIGLLPKNGIEMLAGMQNIHDRVSVAGWGLHLGRIATKYGVQIWPVSDSLVMKPPEPVAAAKPNITVEVNVKVDQPATIAFDGSLEAGFDANGSPVGA